MVGQMVPRGVLLFDVIPANFSLPNKFYYSIFPAKGSNDIRNF